MRTRNSELTVGIFVILAAAALFFLALKVSGLVGGSYGDTYTLTANFNNVNGLKPRAKVSISGVTVGRVNSIQLDPKTLLAHVTLDMDSKLTLLSDGEQQKLRNDAIAALKASAGFQALNANEQNKKLQETTHNFTNITTIDDDAYVSVATNGLLGEKYLKISPGAGEKYYVAGDQIGNTQGTLDLEDLINKFIAGSGSSKPAASPEAPAANTAAVAPAASTGDAAFGDF